MKSANQWLLEKGYIKQITRGRRSRENIDHLTNAYNDGVRFTDWEPKETTNTKGEKVIKNASSKVISNDNYGEPFIRYADDDSGHWVATDESGKERSMRSACNGCGYSLVGHVCDDPRIVNLDGSGSTKVNIVFKRG